MAIPTPTTNQSSLFSTSRVIDSSSSVENQPVWQNGPSSTRKLNVISGKQAVTASCWSPPVVPTRMMPSGIPARRSQSRWSRSIIRIPTFGCCWLWLGRFWLQLWCSSFGERVKWPRLYISYSRLRLFRKGRKSYSSKKGKKESVKIRVKACPMIWGKVK